MDYIMKLRNILFLMCLSVSLVCCPANMDEHKPNIDTSDARVGFFYAMLDTKEGSAKIRYSSKYDIAPAAKVFTKHKVLDATDLPTLSQTGYTFNGWFDASTDGNKIIGWNAGEQTADVVLWARWTPIPPHTITYNGVDGATHSNPSTFTESENIALTDATKSGFTFDGWFDSESAGSMITGWNAGERTADVVLWARWTPIPSHTITYNGVDGATHSNPSTFTESDDITLTDATKSGFTFAGWFDASTDGNQIIGWTSGEKTADVELWARWTAD